jgi:hypothetical protein
VRGIASFELAWIGLKACVNEKGKVWMSIGDMAGD